MPHIRQVKVVNQLLVFHNLHHCGGDHTSLLVLVVFRVIKANQQPLGLANLVPPLVGVEAAEKVVGAIMERQVELVVLEELL